MSMCCFQDRQAVPTAGDDLPGSGAEYELALNRLRLLGEQQPRACGLEVVQKLGDQVGRGAGRSARGREHLQTKLWRTRASRWLRIAGNTRPGRGLFAARRWAQALGLKLLGRGAVSR